MKSKRIWLIVAVGVVVAGVWLWGVLPYSNRYDGVYSDLGEDFDDAFASHLEASSEFRFADLVPFKWETVSFFKESEPAEVIESEIGVSILDEPYFNRSEWLMVFCDEGRIVDVHYYPHGVAFPRDITYSNALEFLDGTATEPSGGRVPAACSRSD